MAQRDSSDDFPEFGVLKLAFKTIFLSAMHGWEGRRGSESTGDVFYWTMCSNIITA